jgi:hypothetical protein
MLDPDQPTVRWAAFGRQVELFLEGDIGSFLLARAERQIEEAAKDLKVADPYDYKAVQKAQNRIVVAESIIEWLGEAIAAGHSAIEELKNAQT